MGRPGVSDKKDRQRTRWRSLIFWMIPTGSTSYQGHQMEGSWAMTLACNLKRLRIFINSTIFKITFPTRVRRIWICHFLSRPRMGLIVILKTRLIQQEAKLKPMTHKSLELSEAHFRKSILEMAFPKILESIPNQPRIQSTSTGKWKHSTTAMKPHPSEKCKPTYRGSKIKSKASNPGYNPQLLWLLNQWPNQRRHQLQVWTRIWNLRIQANQEQ